MNDFTYWNPTRLVFGRGAIARLADLVPARARVLLAYGGGSILKNGVHAQVLAALGERTVVPFAGIEPNPDHATLMKAVARVREERLDFLLAVGGGSVLDGIKYVAAAARWPGPDPWDILRTAGQGVASAVPVGAVLTLPATGSEANPTAVISRRETGEKLYFGADCCYPAFAVLDPQTTFSLPARQVANGIVDAFVHVMEQYATQPAAAPLQDRQAEAILATLVEEAPAILADPPGYDARATFTWCATQALNGLIGCGVPQDWATHMIGHELTALHGLDHGVTLAVVLPGVLRHEVEFKRGKLAQLGRRVFGVDGAEAAIDRVEAFFRSVGQRTRLSEHGVDADAAADRIARRFRARGARFGERGAIGPEEAAAIVRARA
ncbi:MAG TPA: iron-containing alcohol dehydrogenase [Anaeromyxobacter sp.]|nr:iron-containing alcohol dehydrogenase [Anaeromyxobacter sp.]